MKYGPMAVVIAWCVGWTGLAWCSVGQPFKGGIYDLHLPLAMAVFLGVTALLGYIAGASSR